MDDYRSGPITRRGENVVGAVQHVGLTFSEFETSLKERFNNPALVAKLTAEIYNKRQEEDEAVEIFLIKKQQLFRRLQPNTTNAHSKINTATKDNDIPRTGKLRSDMTWETGC
ncbi:hypothetical protein HHI36_000556 [Cryptolaemus montrouzieri]|uniref:Uncharacterized protein n=1 Tax=Cryptolaemus montrouzieri TaxID=559131 RepID=A0ABD2P5S8_9CUCU